MAKQNLIDVFDLNLSEDIQKQQRTSRSPNLVIKKEAKLIRSDESIKVIQINQRISQLNNKMNVEPNVLVANVRFRQGIMAGPHVSRKIGYAAIKNGNRGHKKRKSNERDLGNPELNQLKRQVLNDKQLSWPKPKNI